MCVCVSVCEMDDPTAVVALRDFVGRVLRPSPSVLKLSPGLRNDDCASTVRPRHARACVCVVFEGLADLASTIRRSTCG